MLYIIIPGLSRVPSRVLLASMFADFSGTRCSAASAAGLSRPMANCVAWVRIWFIVRRKSWPQARVRQTSSRDVTRDANRTTELIRRDFRGLLCINMCVCVSVAKLYAFYMQFILFIHPFDLSRGCITHIHLQMYLFGNPRVTHISPVISVALHQARTEFLRNVSHSGKHLFLQKEIPMSLLMEFQMFKC